MVDIDIYKYDVNELPAMYEIDSVTIKVNESDSIIRPSLVIDTMYNLELESIKPKSEFRQSIQFGPIKVAGRLPRSFITSYDLIIRNKEDSSLIERRRVTNEWKLTGKLRIVDLFDGV